MLGIIIGNKDACCWRCRLLLRRDDFGMARQGRL
jgi:hypothetical protein